MAVVGKKAAKIEEVVRIGCLSAARQAKKAAKIEKVTGICCLSAVEQAK